MLTANVRVASVETEGEITVKLKEIAERHDLICELAGGRDAAPESRADSEGYRNMSGSVKEIYPGLPIIPFVLGGGTDSRHFQELTDNVLRFSPMYAAPEQEEEFTQTTNPPTFRQWRMQPPAIIPF